MRLAVLLVALLAASCRVGPHYKVPPSPAPPNFKEAPPADWKEASPQDDTLRDDWWQMFGDADLSALEEQVQISNQQIASAEARFRAARAAVGITRSALFPTISVGASANTLRAPTNRTIGPSGTAAASTGNFFQLPVDISYEADLWGRIRNAVAANKFVAQATAADLETVKLSTHSELSIDYFQLRGLDEEQRLVQSSVEAYRQALQLTKNRYDQGIASQIDVAQAQAQLDITIAQEIDIGVMRAQLEHAIAILIGKPPADLTIVVAPSGPTQPPVVPVALPSELLERRPDIASAERQAASANAMIGVARAAYFPTISLNATSGLESIKLANLLKWPNRFWTLGASLSEVVFDGGARKSSMAQAEAIFDEAAATYRQTVLTGFQEVEDNLSTLRILADEARQQDIAVQSAQALLDLSMNRYRGGVASYLEVIVAQTVLLNNQRTAVTIHTRRMAATVLLIKALGGGWDRTRLVQ